MKGKSTSSHCGYIIKRGIFIVFEGLDRSGKTTQLNILAEYLTNKGYNVFKLTFPDRSTETGRVISSYLERKIELSDEKIHELFAENRKEKMDLIKSLLNDGIIILCDRYAFSGVAFSAVKGLDYNWCR